MQEKNTSPWIMSELSDWAPVLSRGHLTRFDRGSCIFSQGERSDSVYIVKEGRVLLSVLSRDGTEKILMFVGRGGIFGEQSVFDSAPQFCCATPIVNCEIYIVPSGIFRECLKENPDFSMRFIRLLTRKESILSAQIAELSFGSAFQRTAAELVYSADIYGVKVKDGILIDLPITHQDLGDKIHATRVTVSRALKRLCDEGIIGVRKRRFVIRNMTALRNAAASNTPDTPDI